MKMKPHSGGNVDYEKFPPLTNMHCMTERTFYIRPFISCRMSWRPLIVAAAMTFGMTCSAQNNPLKINDQLYEMYDKAFRTRETKAGLDLAQQMYHKAQTLNDRKAQVIALTIPMLYYYKKRDDSRFEQAVKELQDKALQFHQERYFYYAVSNRTNYLLYKKRMYEALTYAQSMTDYAKKSGSKYGTFTCTNMLGTVHLVRMEIGLAADYYIKSLKYSEENIPTQNTSRIYRDIASCYEELYRYEDMLNYAEQGYQKANRKEIQLRLLHDICYAAFMLEKYDVFAKYSPMYDKLLGQKPNGASKDYVEREMAILEAFYSKDYDAAKRDITSYEQQSRRQYRLWIEYNRLVGDYLEMTKAQTKLYRTRIREQDSVRSSNFMEMNSKFINQKLEYENQQLEMDRQRLLSEQQTTELKNTHLKLANSQLTLKNSSLELRRAKSSSDLLRLSYDNKQLEADKLLNELNAEKAQKRLHDALLLSAFAIGMLVLLAVGVYIWNRRKLMKKLRNANDSLEENNNELIVAKEKAVAADRVKTVFIQNMSHEIRTPLNAIVGFSELIANDDGSMDEAMRDDFSERIKTNSDNLLMLVSDVLDTAQLENGTYNLQYRSCTVGEICRKAMAATGQHKQPGVKVRLETDALENIVIHTDVKRVVQVLTNMLTNAEKNTAEGTITLGCSTTSNPGMVTFSVTDTGIGVPPEKSEEIFKSFTKLDQFKQGLGLGLHICRIIANLLGGKIYLDTKYQGGARFLFAIKA